MTTRGQNVCHKKRESILCCAGTWLYRSYWQDEPILSPPYHNGFVIYLQIGYSHEADDHAAKEQGEVDENSGRVVCVAVLFHLQHVLDCQNIVEHYFLNQNY